MLIALLATLMFFAMLAATFNALRSETRRAPVRVKAHSRREHGVYPW